jgi:hypothetical protein
MPGRHREGTVQPRRVAVSGRTIACLHSQDVSPPRLLPTPVVNARQAAAM